MQLVQSKEFRLFKDLMTVKMFIIGIKLSIIIINLKKLFKNLIENEDFSKKEDLISVPDMFSKVKKGSQKYREILLGNKEVKSAPKMKIEADWKISEKQGRENFFEKAFSFWKNSCLPARIQLMLLKISNHQLKLNSQLKHLAIKVKWHCIQVQNN